MTAQVFLSCTVDSWQFIQSTWRKVVVLVVMMMMITIMKSIKMTTEIKGDDVIPHDSYVTLKKNLHCATSA